LRRVLELGAGAALPSLVCSRLAAEFLLITDYPDPGILSNIELLLSQNRITTGVAVMGHIWGDDVTPMLTAGKSDSDPVQFDVIIMAELLWRDTYPLHQKLLSSASQCLASGGIALVSFAKRPIDPGSAEIGMVPHNDDDFFVMASKMGFVALQLLSVQKHDVCSNEMVEVTITSLTKT
jgi:predicted nicotinamide N-methyase